MEFFILAKGKHFAKAKFALLHNTMGGGGGGGEMKKMKKNSHRSLY
jgi:hypothetical protein